MTTKKKRQFIVYANFLGGGFGYPNPDLLVYGRELLEQALAQCFVPALEGDNMHLYVVGDAAVILCPNLSPLLDPLGKLFACFLGLGEAATGPALELCLRAGILVGATAEVDHLTNGRRIRTIPFLNRTVPLNYKLESVRKGSRIFLEAEIPSSAYASRSEQFYRWKQITGHGPYVADVIEYLWPAVAYPDERHFVEMTEKIYQIWMKNLDLTEWEPEKYYSHMLNLDETVKLFIRTSSCRLSFGVRRALLMGMLPSIDVVQKNVRYKWGVWFQILKGIVEICVPDTPESKEVVAVFEPVYRILEKHGFLQHFIRELAYPDYADFQANFRRLGLGSPSRGPLSPRR